MDLTQEQIYRISYSIDIEDINSYIKNNIEEFKTYLNNENKKIN